MEAHEACNLFPLMTPDEFAALKADIAERGQQEPILVWQGKIVDGRNRARACGELGILPKRREWDGHGSMVAAVLSLNLHRRHLTISQRSIVAVESLPLFEAEAAARQRANLKQGNLVDGAMAADPVSANLRSRSAEPASGPEPNPDAGKAAAHAARAVGVSPRSVETAKRLKVVAPAVFDKVRAGKLNLNEASKEVARQKATRDAAVTKAVYDLAGVAGDATYIRNQTREKFFKATTAFRDKVAIIDINALADAMEPPFSDGAYRFIDDTRRWLNKLEGALTRGLRVVGGE